ncbi:hypothetical protein CAPI_07050 [Corynebacterium capitovis DSM 44611]|nr:hypothetical protein CAPI_07050 [Corynebacterium capitovis DSM 44611]
MPLVVLIGPGQGGDNPMGIPLLENLRVQRACGRPRTRPDELRTDKAYSSRQVRDYLRKRRITATIPEPADRIANRKRKGSRGGRPPAFDTVSYKGRNVVERRFCDFKHAIVYRAGVVIADVVAWLKII